MSSAEAKANRPLSPHLCDLRWPLTHGDVDRASHHRRRALFRHGAARLVADRGGERPSAPSRLANAFFGSWLGRLILFGFTWALIHHLLGGIRHLVWDTGAGLGKPARDAHRAGPRIIGSVVLTLVVWVVGLRGALMAMPHAARAVSAGSAPPMRAPAHFWRQRLTAVALTVPLTIAFVVLIVALIGEPLCDGRRDASPRRFVALILVADDLSIAVHMRIGMQVIIEDYVHGEGQKLALLVANDSSSRCRRRWSRSSRC